MDEARRPFFYGQIVLASVDDGHGNRKNRPVVIVVPPGEPGAGECLRVVCISTQVEDPCPAHHIALPWRRPRHPRTGLDKPNVAKCDWRATIFESDVLQDLGHVPPAFMGRIDEALKALGDEAETTA